jgi:hypothetical protein
MVKEPGLRSGFPGDCTVLRPGIPALYKICSIAIGSSFANEGFLPVIRANAVNAQSLYYKM